MTKHWLLLAALLAVAACDDSSPNPVNGNPVVDPDNPDDPGDGGGDGGGDDGDPIGGGGSPLPGTGSPTTEEGLFRREARDGTGNGFAEAINYDAASDTFTVDNLGFDGDNVFTRDNTVPNLGPFRVYESAEFFPDGATGTPIEQLPHKALYGTSPSGSMEFAIVRTGGYVPYGFGGFVFQRNEGVVLPTTGQATYSGPYAGLRDFQGRSGLEYTVAEMTLDIDFEDFNDGDAVKGEVFNRQIFNLDGVDVTADVLAGLAEQNNVPFTSLPVLRFVIGPGVLNVDSGEINGQLNSFVQDAGGALQQFEAGNYYAVIGGPNAEEVLGVIVVEADDPRFDGVVVRETGGFALTR